jgi:hypothetical protein
MPERIEVLPPSQPKKSRAGCWVGMGVGCLLFLALLVLGVPWLRAEAKRDACRNTIRSIGIAMHLYADDNGNSFPENLRQLYTENYTDNPKIFSCPARPSQYQEFKSGPITERSSSYTYVSGLTSSMPGTFILLYDKDPSGHPGICRGGGRNVLHIDCSAELWPASREAEFQRRLALQAETIAKWRGSGKAGQAADGPSARNSGE